jgi:hypothetical protein
MLRAEPKTRRFDWRRAILEAELQPTTKLVAFVLSMHMSRAGDSCFPGLALLRQETGLARSAVQEHLLDLMRLGWIVRAERVGQPTMYLAAFPEAVVAEIVAEATAGDPPARKAGTEADNPPSTRAQGEPSTRAGQTDTPALEDGATRPRPALLEGPPIRNEYESTKRSTGTVATRDDERTPETRAADEQLGFQQIAEALADSDPAAQAYLDRKKKTA